MSDHDIPLDADLPDGRPGCPPLEELALGLLDGPERAATLAHVAHCAECRHDLEVLSTLVDDLVVIAPPMEPPHGLEDRVLARAPLPRAPAAPARPRQPTRVAVAAVAVAVLLVVAGVGVALGTRNHGPSTAASTSADMRTPAGAVVGEVTLAGHPGGVLLAVPGWDGWSDGDYSLRVVLDDGTTRGGTVHLDEGFGGYGLGPVSVGHVKRVELRDSHGKLGCSADL